MQARIGFHAGRGLYRRFVATGSVAIGHPGGYLLVPTHALLSYVFLYFL